MEISSLETIIKRYIKLPNHPSGTGWYPVLCKVCNDSGRKGPRAGFKFDGNKVAFHCFNCSMATVFDPDKHQNMPDKMVQVLQVFNIPEDEWKTVLYENLKLRDEFGNTQSKPDSGPIISIEPAVISLPSHFYPLAEAGPNDTWAQLASAYLDTDRGIDPKSYNFMLCQPNGDPQVDKWAKRVIIPIYKEKQLIFYVGRDLTGNQQQKYLSPSYSKEKVLFGFDELFHQTEDPLYIVEGWFDAVAINGIAILGNEISEAQATWLNRSQRKKVYIPDRFGDGQIGAERALALGWSIATPGLNTWSDEIKDMNDAVLKYGKMFLMKALADTTADGFTAKINLGFYCKNGKTNKSRSSKENSKASKSKRTRS